MIVCANKLYATKCKRTLLFFAKVEGEVQMTKDKPESLRYKNVDIKSKVFMEDFCERFFQRASCIVQRVLWDLSEYFKYMIAE